MRDRTSAAGGAARGEKVPGMSPVRAFFLLGAVAAVVPLTILATRPEAAPTTPPEATRGPDFSLTDAEAIAEFERLHAMFRGASRNRDVSMLKLMLVPDSPLWELARAQIRQLITDGVLDRSRFVFEELEVIQNTGERVVIKQEVTLHPRFVNESTGRVVSDTSPLRQRVEWTLMLDGTSWRVYDSVVEASRRIQ